MVLNKMKDTNKTAGFTIVELLIVIVVIGILAAITIVAYSGITARANTTKAQTNAVQTQKVAETYNAELSAYPKTTANFGAAPTAKLPSGVTLFYTGGTGVNATPSATNGGGTVWYQWCGSTNLIGTSDAQGGRIQYWDFSTNALAVAPAIIYVGTGSATLGAGVGTACNTWFTPAS